jgi:type II secretory ATPase GspE/PulE/Tfp pilus assembly ATPase PilB-like protein
MLAGTFNLVMAQRLARRVCTQCKKQISVKDNVQYTYAKDSFRNYDEDALRKEISSRNITQKQRDDFMVEGLIDIGTGKNPETGETCEACGGSGYK